MPTLLIDESNYLQQIRYRRDRLPRDQRDKPGYLTPFNEKAYLAYADPAESHLQPIPRSRWPELIRRYRGNFLGDHTRPLLKPHDQDRTNYCWSHATIRTLEAHNAWTRKTGLLFSPESVAVPLTNGRNEGGWPEDAMKRLITHGACRADYWPANDRDIHHAKPGWSENAALHRVKRFIYVRDFDMQMTCAFHRIALAILLPWWNHAVCQLDPLLFDDGTFGLGCDNSYGPDYGENGYFLLTERRGTTDPGAVGILSTTFFSQ